MNTTYTETIELTPSELLTCRRLRENPRLHVRVVCAYDEVGAKTALYEKSTLSQRRADLEILERLAIAPGDVRTARDILERLGEKQPTPQSVEERIRVKEESAEKIRDCTQLVIRAHHMLCIVCHIAREDNETPLFEDNLYEAWVKIRENPNIPIKLIEGAAGCMICPPCHAYDPETGQCVAGCALRDMLKDAETFRRLGISPGEVLPAHEVVERIYREIPTVDGICSFGGRNSNEWASCEGWQTRYPAGLKKGFFKK